MQPNWITVKPKPLSLCFTSAPRLSSISTISYWLKPASVAKLSGPKPANDGTELTYSG